MKPIFFFKMNVTSPPTFFLSKPFCLINSKLTTRVRLRIGLGLQPGRTRVGVSTRARVEARVRVFS